MERKERQGKDAESIMNTNNSCIVSKRSVEKIYHNCDNGFLRHFVKKFQRRSPLINRGYWLRMRAVETVVKTFLANHEGKRKLVVNLGCGYDTLPFKLLAQQDHLCEDACFIDVDYQDLIDSKCKVIRETPQLCELIRETESTEPGVLLESKDYVAVACDLQNTIELHRLGKILYKRNMPILFVAEVAMTYMDIRKADAVIHWASTFADAHFCLLEQYLPDTPTHPFAQTMLNHFKRLQSPLQAPIQYQSLESQQQRFDHNGWGNLSIQSLWDLWSDDDFIDPEQRKSLDEIEPFDEWEEFVLFASHYLLLVAGQLSINFQARLSSTRRQSSHRGDDASWVMESEGISFKPNGRGQGLMRRNGASCLHPQSNSVVFQGGQGTKGRLKDCIRLSQQPQRAAGDDTQALESPPSIELTCHTFTMLKDGSVILVGGRTSPASASRSCFLCRDRQWIKVEDLPFGLYRHGAVACGPGVLVFGGKTDSTHISARWLLWENGEGWQEIKPKTNIPGSRFGMCLLPLDRKMAKGGTTVIDVHGLLFGGINEKGAISADPYFFTVTRSRTGHSLSLECTKYALELNRINSVCFERFGAKITRNGQNSLIVGGVWSSGTINHEFEILQLSSGLKCTLGPKLEEPRPLLVGFEMQTLPKDGCSIIFGGGAVCFSFGTFWNPGIWHFGSRVTEQTQFSITDFTVREKSSQPSPKQKKSTSTARSGNSNSSSIVHTNDNLEPLLIPKIRLRSSDQFLQILQKSEPVVIEGLDIGDCVDKWTNEYLKTRIGFDREVTVHKSSNQQMSFLDKNFTYSKQPFWDFIESIERGEASYLRAVSSSKPAERATKLGDDFPTIADDFILPMELEYVSKNVHSSPLRISGPVAMWLHYDVMANVLCQIRGRKRLILYHPGDVRKLGFPPGASSSRLNAFDENTRCTTSLGEAQAYEAQLNPNDVLFIPAFWAHTAAATEGDISVAVNVFFRNLQQDSYSAGKDVYGNRDLQAYENGRRELQKMTRAFRGLPEQASRFYLGRLADELEELITSWEKEDEW